MAQEIWVVVSTDPQGTVYVTYNKDNDTLGVTNSVQNATAFTLIRAEEVRRHANSAFRRLATNYDRFGIVSLKPTP